MFHLSPWYNLPKSGKEKCRQMLIFFTPRLRVRLGFSCYCHGKRKDQRGGEPEEAPLLLAVAAVRGKDRGEQC